MGKYNLSDVGKIFSISCFNDYVVMIGGKLWIFKTDGTLIAYKKNIVNPGKITFLSDDRLLVECGKQKAYILLSLIDGAELTRIPMPNMDFSSKKFAVSADCSFVYDFYHLENNNYFIRINLIDLETYTYYLAPGLRVIADIMCDGNDVPCLLETHYEMIEKNHISVNGIRYVHQEEIDPGSSYYWKYKWFFEFPMISSFFMGNTEKIISNDLQIYDCKTGKKYPLLENETIDGHLSSITIDSDGKYITLKYSTMNVIVDLATKKMVARYAVDDTLGCLIGEEFWVYSGKGILRKPFPMIEEISPKKYNFNWP